MLRQHRKHFAAIPVVKRGISYHYFFAHVFFRVSYNRLVNPTPLRSAAYRQR